MIVARRKVTWVVFISISASLFGCGGEDHSSPSAPPGASYDYPIKDRDLDFLYAGV